MDAKRTVPDHVVRVSKYRWEFLRRNSEYRRQWEKLQERLRKEWGQRMGPPDGRMAREQAEFCLEWSIGNPMDPDQGYDEMLAQCYEGWRSLGLKRLVKPDCNVLLGELINGPELFKAIWNPPVTVPDGWDYDFCDDKLTRAVRDECVESGRLTVQINLNYSKRRLKKEFTALLDEWIELYNEAHRTAAFRKFCEERELDPHTASEEIVTPEFESAYKRALQDRRRRHEKKYHFDNFDVYLQVFDLRKAKRSWSEIKTALDLNSVSAARNHYKAACELIEKGIDVYAK